jgi:D-arabinose 1-dehydrogenase-like Zn-dependent alcohol dehydrogenase
MYCNSPGGVIGINQDGAFAQYVIVDAHVAAKLPDNIDFVQAAPL